MSEHLSQPRLAKITIVAEVESDDPDGICLELTEYIIGNPSCIGLEAWCEDAGPVDD